jgi:farnesyl-diphosphate farnesyltransferase
MDETRMMSVADGQMLWQIYAKIPAEPRASIARWALEMAHGMEQVINPHQADFFFTRDGVRLPAKEDDYDRYCYYVAGTVGHMITELAINHYGLQGEIAERLPVNSEASGRALQKTNIIKDFAKDLQRGACFLPDEWLQQADYTPLTLSGAPDAWIEKVIANVLVEFDNSVEYVLDLPHSAAGFRQASLLMMLPGYQTLLVAAKNQDRLFTPAHNIKISRRTMAKCMLDARRIVKNDEAILAYSRNARVELSKVLNSDRITSFT